MDHVLYIKLLEKELKEQNVEMVKLKSQLGIIKSELNDLKTNGNLRPLSSYSNENTSGISGDTPRTSEARRRGFVTIC
jgi:hypothetical protein